MTRIVSSDTAPAAIGPYSQGIIAGGFLFSAGQIPIDPATTQVVEGDIVPQTQQVLKNLQAVLAAAGASWKDVVKTTVYRLRARLAAAGDRTGYVQTVRGVGYLMPDLPSAGPEP